MLSYQQSYVLKALFCIVAFQTALTSHKKQTVATMACSSQISVKT